MVGNKKKLSSQIFQRFRRIIINSIVTKIYKFFFYVLGHLHVNKKLIIFESFLGKQFSCNPRALYEYIKKNYPDYTLIWSVDKKHINNFLNHDLNYVKRFSISWIIAMTKSRYWISNSRLPYWIPKPKHTIYIQTWHGTPLKKLVMDMNEVHMPGIDIEKYKKDFCQEANKWDYLISPNTYSSEIFSRAFQFNKTIIESGYPRNDILHQSINEKSITNVKLQFGLPENKKVILYAPTWRDNQFYDQGRYKFDLNLDLDLLQRELSEDYIILLRLHYLVAENLDLKKYKNFIFDFSNHEDIRDLYLISDMLMTDYSSVFFDFANLFRPIIFYVYDLEEYRDKLRGFYFDLEKNAPGPLVTTTTGIIKSIRAFEANGNKMLENFSSFYNKFCYLEDGNASRRVVEAIFSENLAEINNKNEDY
ncbi:CDP-glycerol glycerophosphotransferase family protein [Terrilactibacillus laevilacticus]|uniref:CDP-glycerol glycerophosphotransferase family protein n=1 Tax=Terrilactibacillus laevilacticus TaxID=1380157 RepID=A0ABW5PQ85_9BACI